jgi:hypothetical protein
MNSPSTQMVPKESCLLIASSQFLSELAINNLYTVKYSSIVALYTIICYIKI